MSTRLFQTIHLASDHAGFEHKESVKQWLTEEGFTVVDHGADNYHPEDDFPQFMLEAGRAIQGSDSTHAGIIFGGSGQGEAMVANRLKGIRAGVFYGGNIELVRLMRQHNNANVLSIGARFVSLAEVKVAISEFIHTAFSEEAKYSRRNEQIDTQV